MKKKVRFVALISIMFMFTCTSVIAAEGKRTPNPDSTTNYQNLQLKAGFNLGWDYPYSAGIELSLLYKELVDVNLGFGFGLSGSKLGAGLRLFPLRKSQFSPMLGAYFYHASGLNKLTVVVNGQEAEYEITSDDAVLLNAGGRYRFGKGHYVVAGIGYSFAFKGEKSKYKSGSTDQILKSYADSLSTGGLSINFGILFKINKGNYK